jgi:hypothetical protein
MRKYESKDYATVCKWWKGYAFPAMPEILLPKNGLIIDGKCAGFLYSTDSGIAWMEFVVGNPEISKEERDGALDALIHGLARMAKDLGFMKVFTSTNSNRFTKRLLDCGFVVGDASTIQLIRSI